MKKVLTVAGSDCSGGAGIQADLKTFAAHGVYGMSVIVSVVAENTFHVTGVQDISPDIIKKQMDAVFEDIPPDAVKIGMLSSPACIRAVAAKIKEYRPRNIVIDPVMVAKNGWPLMGADAAEAFMREMIPLADLLTPNIPETEKITGIKINSAEDMEGAAVRICGLGARNVLVKGGHAKGDALDVLYGGGRFCRFSAARIHTQNTHGTGCTYSSAIAANLALGRSLEDAVQSAKEYVTTAIRHALDIGKGCGPTNHFYDLYIHGLQKGEKNEGL